ncbi:ash family protein [Pantoea piersonii]|uniref:ash family protein n=1 Tax=Pantoea piersonii TaxID=2364647 RepID=UPI0035E45836
MNQGVSMVALVGLPSGRPVFLCTGSSNPVNVTTRRLEAPVVTHLKAQGAFHV